MKSTKVICPVCGTEIAISEHEHTVSNATVIGKDSNLGTIELPVAKPGKADDRLNALRAAGVDTSNLFAMRSASGEGMVVRINNGVPEMVSDDDPIFTSIVNGGTIPERRLFRRWITAQMFALIAKMNQNNRRYWSINDAIRRLGYEYQWKMTLEEMRVQAVLFDKDRENFEARNSWFDCGVCRTLASEYIDNLRKYIESLNEHRCKGVPYKKIGGRNVFVSDINNKIIIPLFCASKKIDNAHTPKDVYEALKAFDKMRIKLDNKHGKFCQTWIDAYKGAGAYFTMKNLIMFHGCRIHGDKTNEVYTKETSLELLEERMHQYHDEGWRMFAMMKKLIKDNNIDIEAKRKEWREAKLNK